MWRAIWKNGLTAMTHEHIGIIVRDAPRPGVEKVPARRVGDCEWELLCSPLYATEAAAGDTIRIIDPQTGEFAITKRGGNVCVHFYLSEREIDDERATSSIASRLSSEVKAIGGRVDAQTPGLISLTIPVAAGFPAIEKVLKQAVGRHPGAQWEYSNVYDPATGDPLRWWE